MNTDLIWVAIAFLFGGFLNFWLGWSKSGEPFAIRKFFSTMIIVLVSAVATVGTYSASQYISIPDLVAVFGLGFACDGVIKNGAAVITAKVGGKTNA